MRGRVVRSAEEFHVGDARLSSIGPMNDVMGVAPRGGAVTVGKDAAAVAENQGETLGG